MDYIPGVRTEGGEQVSGNPPRSASRANLPLPSPPALPVGACVVFWWLLVLLTHHGFPDSSVGKESACSAGDSGSIPGSGSFPGEGIGYPLPYSWVSLVAQLVKYPPAVRETWVQSLGWGDSLEKGKATLFSILAWRIPWGRKELDKTERLSLTHSYNYIVFNKK